MPPDNIPRIILGGTPPGDQVDEQLGLLASYSMITLTEDAVSIHRLVQAVILAIPEQTQAESDSPAGIALDWLNQALPPDPGGNVAAWPLLRALVPHADSLSSRYPDGTQPVRLGRVQNDIGVFHQSQGDYQQALASHESALRIHQARLGSDHPDVASCLGNLAASYGDLGRAADALPLFERALQITETVRGPDHPDVAIALGNLAVTYGDLGRAWRG